MAALTQDRNTKRKFKQRVVALDVAASTKIYAGAMVGVTAAGYAVPASDTAGLTIIGRAEEQVDNSSGADGDESIRVANGVFKYANAGANSVDQADIGQDVYVSDDQTVVKALGATNNIVAGKAQEIDPDGDIWVAVGL